MLKYLVLLFIIIFLINKKNTYEKFDSYVLKKNIKKGTYIIPFIVKHCNTPNTIVINYNGSYYLKAIKEIKKHEHITFKYEDDYNNPNINNIKIKKSKIHGNGIFMKKNILKDKVLFTAIIDKNVTFLAKFINHNKKGNTTLLKKKNKYLIITNKNINSGEEITIDYDKTPYFIKKSNPLWN
tara:strand:- start:136 stop:681 length:546 start_codon:yes stop_codon:yes gene_type:complete